jgi:hypothetical protein
MMVVALNTYLTVITVLGVWGCMDMADITEVRMRG